MPERSPDVTNKTKVTNKTQKSQPAGVLPPQGGYEDLLSFQKARIVYDGTVRFCERFVDRRSRTHDQMTQGARSGKQNIVEASQASGTSKGTELKLTNVAEPALKNSSKTIATFYAPVAIRCGAKIPRKPSLFVVSVRNPMCPMSPIGLMWKAARATSWPISSSASSTRPPTCSTSKSASRSGISSRKVACVSACLGPVSPLAAGEC
jgi:hypothetical protein